MTIASSGHGQDTGSVPVVSPRISIFEDDTTSYPETQFTELPRRDVVNEAPWRVLAAYRRWAVVADFSVGAMAGLVAYLTRFGFHERAWYIVLATTIPFLWVASVTVFRAYEYRFFGAGPEEYGRVAMAGLVLFTSIAVFSFAIPGEISRAFVLMVVPLTLVSGLISRKILRTWLYGLRAHGTALQRVLVVGRADGVVSVIEKLDREPEHGLVAVGACVPSGDIEVSHVHGVPVMGSPAAILSAVEATGAHVVAVVSHPDLSGHSLRRLSWALEERGIELMVSPGIIEVAGPRISIRPVAGMSLLHLERPNANGARMAAKAIFDRVVSGLILFAVSPILLITAAAVKLTSRGPVLFRQKRIGVDGEPFMMLKFRSMVVDAEARKAALMHMNEGNGVLFKMRDDPRITRVGAFIRRYSIDELPQLINVLKGDMSLVGPRPPLPEEVAAYSADATRRLRVRPGITGLWQVSGRSDLSWEESLRLDLRYVDNWTMAQDMSILWRTWRAVFQGAGAY